MSPLRTRIGKSASVSLLPALLLATVALHGTSQAVTTASPTITPSCVSDHYFNVTATPGETSTLYYTEDGTDPTQFSPIVPSSGIIPVGTTMTLKVCALASGKDLSPFVSANYYLSGKIQGTANSAILRTVDGHVYTWGAQGQGKLGNGLTAQANVYTSPYYLSSTQADDVAAGYAHCLMLDTTGQVWGFGDDAFGELGNNGTTDSGTPVKVLNKNVAYASATSADFLSTATAVSAGVGFSIALRNDGKVVAWGDRAYGRVGDGYTSGTDANQKWAHIVDTSVTGTSPADSDGSGYVDLSGITQISSGGFFNLALGSLDAQGRGQVWAWGYNSAGEIGQGNTTTAAYGRAVKVKLDSSGAYLNDVVEIAAGHVHTVCIRQDASGNRTVWCWGQQGAGRLGNGVTTTGGKPYPGTVYSWSGGGVHWQDASGVDQGQLTNVLQVAAGPDHSMALKSDGTVWAWGYNDDGQLGDGTTTSRSLAIQVSLPEFIVGIGAGGIQLTNPDGSVTYQSFSYAIGASGQFYGWGFNTNGEIGKGNLVNPQKTPQASPMGIMMMNYAPFAPSPSISMDPYNETPDQYIVNIAGGDPDGNYDHTDIYVDGAYLGAYGSFEYGAPEVYLDPAVNHTIMAAAFDTKGAMTTSAMTVAGTGGPPPPPPNGITMLPMVDQHISSGGSGSNPTFSISCSVYNPNNLSVQWSIDFDKVSGYDTGGTAITSFDATTTGILEFFTADPYYVATVTVKDMSGNVLASESCRIYDDDNAGD